jgi:hypothetical protein
LRESLLIKTELQRERELKQEAITAQHTLRHLPQYIKVGYHNRLIEGDRP